MNKIIFLFFLLFLNCTYYLKPPLPEGIKTIGVENFSNSSERLGIEIFVTQSFIDGILEDRRIPLKDLNNCDLLIKGEITRYLRSPFGVTGGGEVFSYKVIIRAKINFLKKDGSQIFEGREFQGESVYDAREKSEEDAIKEAAKDLSRKVIQYIYAQAI